MTASSALKSFLNVLSDVLVAAATERVEQTFEVGDSVYYSGSKESDHGYWKVEAVDGETGRVTLGHYGTWRQLEVNTSTLMHADPAKACQVCGKPEPHRNGSMVWAHLDEV